ncbi:MAG TPA: hypothetical protein VFD39_10595, partial [Trueperaceae bacterium]|nr:hypothetical protein [Trueperaceae bacterium]
MSREQHDGAGRPRDENETDAVNEALASERLLAPAIEALVSTLDEEELTAGSWEALRGKLQVDAPTSEERATRPAAIGRANAPPTTRRARWHENARSKGHDGAAETPMLPPVSPRGGNATARWAVGLV